MSIREDAKDYIEKRLDINLGKMESTKHYRPLTASLNYDTLSVSYNRSKRLASQNIQGRNDDTKYFASTSYAGTGSIGPQRPQTAANDTQSVKLSLRFKDLMRPTSEKIADTRVKNIVKKRLGLWMRSSNLQPIDAFFKILAKELGENVLRSTKIDRDLFARCLLLLDIGIDEKSASKYAEDIADKEGKIDANAFISNLSDEDKDDLNHIRDIIHLNSLNFEDILKTMDITKEGATLDMFTISKGINRLDPKMAKSKADQIALQIMGKKDTITTYDLIESLEGINAGDSKADLDSNVASLRKVRIRLMDSENPKMLLEEFEKWDESHSGLLDPANFKTCLLRLKKQLDLTIGEINRIGRYTAKEKNGLINYLKFLELIDGEVINLTLAQAGALNPDSLFSVKILANSIKDYLKTHKISLHRLLVNIRRDTVGNVLDKIQTLTGLSDEELRFVRTELSIDDFSHFVVNKLNVHKAVRYDTVQYYVSKIDIDKDGIIDPKDLEIFLSRHSLIEDHSLRLVDAVKATTGEDYASAILQGHNQDKLYPIAPLAKSKIDSVLRAVRAAIGSRNISFREFFDKLDENKDGMITFDEFSSGLKPILSLSKNIVKGLFAYMDRNQIGMIDFSNFIKVIKKTVLDNLEEKGEDNFGWQVDVIKSIQKWFFSNNISSEDAFRIVDTDFDQNISQNDMRHFLETVLFIPNEEITSIRLDRLFKLIDQYKKNKITFEDFRRILTEDFNPTDNMSLTGGAVLDKHSFDWRLNARQKIGIYISRKYLSADASFDDISNQGTRITFELFNKWLFKTRALEGFNLTEKLVKDLFSDFDPHKKGHLSKTDWKYVFGKFSLTQLSTTIRTLSSTK
jgi:Ca2+-binding EF-hand superfamily protein